LTFKAQDLFSPLSFSRLANLFLIHPAARRLSLAPRRFALDVLILLPEIFNKPPATALFPLDDLPKLF